MLQRSKKIEKWRWGRQKGTTSKAYIVLGKVTFLRGLEGSISRLSPVVAQATPVCLMKGHIPGWNWNFPTIILLYFHKKNNIDDRRKVSVFHFLQYLPFFCRKKHILKVWCSKTESGSIQIIYSCNFWFRVFMLL